MMQPISASRRLVEGVGELLALRAENARLREQNLRLLEWQSAARQLSVENAALRQLLRCVPIPTCRPRSPAASSPMRADRSCTRCCSTSG